VRSDAIIEQMWQIFEHATGPKKTPEANKNAGQTAKRKLDEVPEPTEDTNGKSDDTSRPEKKTKKKRANDDDENGEPVVSPEEEDIADSKFKWAKVIKAILREADDHEMKLKKLRKRVMAAYNSDESKVELSKEEFMAKFNQKVNKNRKIRILNDRVKLLDQ